MKVLSKNLFRSGFALAVVVTLMLDFRDPGEHDRLRILGEAAGFAAIAALGAVVISPHRLTVFYAGLLIFAGAAQVLQFIPEIPGEPSWADFWASELGVCVGLCGLTALLTGPILRNSLKDEFER